ncbi:MAG: four helix bundle protein [Balneolaceae bacterium]|nr:four helix bundle protein [Balneolaceae bacterium]
MKYKFEDLKVWQLSLDLGDCVYELSEDLPEIERFNLKSQIIRAITSVSLNIAEGSTSQSDAQQSKFIGYAIRSLIEVIACIRIIERRNYLHDSQVKNKTEVFCHNLFIKLQAFRNSLS